MHRLFAEIVKQMNSKWTNEFCLPANDFVFLAVINIFKKNEFKIFT